MMDYKPRILAVDDKPENLMALGAALACEFDLQIATSGEMALALAGESQPDLILLDVMMPEMDGYEVCRRLKGNPKTEHIPVIFVTALHQLQDQEYGFALGAVDYITKPFLISLVMARVRVHIRLQQKVASPAGTTLPGEARPSWVLNSSPRQLVPPGFPPIKLSAQDHTVLQVLASTDGGASRRAIVDALGGDFFTYDQRRLDTQMRRLRRKVEQACGLDLPVSTLRGVGYHFHADIVIQK